MLVWPKSARQHPELDFQKSVAKYLRYALPDDWRFTASAAGVPLPMKVALDLKQAGQEPGWSDLILKHRKSGRVRWLEIKSLTGRFTPEQIEFRDECPQNYAVASVTLEHVEAALIPLGYHAALHHPERQPMLWGAGGGLLAIDLFAGLSGWGEGLVATGWHVVGFDIEDMFAALGEPKHDHFDLVLQDVRTLNGGRNSGTLI